MATDEKSFILVHICGADGTKYFYLNHIKLSQNITKILTISETGESKVNLMRKILTSILSELKLIFIPTVQFLLGSWLVIMLVVTLFDYIFRPQWIVGIFLIFWIFCSMSLCGIFWHYKQRKYVFCYRALSCIVCIEIEIENRVRLRNEMIIVVEIDEVNRI